MTFINLPHSLRALLITLCLGLCLSPCLAWGDTESDEDSLGLITAWQPTPLTTSRFPRPASKIAENVTVITAADIERLNAHTLAEVLHTVPGIQLDYLRTPTNFSFFNLQGVLNTTVLVLVDGIRQNDYFQNLAFAGNIPVQQIERVEIVKGAASTAWGSALGGVINVVTKSPNPERVASGVVSGSIGSHYTADSRAELSGTLGKFGYYLTAGNLVLTPAQPPTLITSAARFPIPSPATAPLRPASGI
jgi:vitamin B12 transporter